MMRVPFCMYIRCIGEPYITMLECFQISECHDLLLRYSL